MDVQLKELIEKIKAEGVESAEKKAADIIAEAEKKAEEIRRKAQEEGGRIIETAEKEAEKLQTTGKEALQQAGRNLLLGLKEKIERVFRAVVVEETGKALTGEPLKDLIVRIVGSMKPEELGNMEILIGDKELKQLETSLHNALSGALKSGLELKPVESSVPGFRLSEKGGGAYFDFTAAGAADMLCEYLNPRLSEILREAVKED
ncbi:MAG: V-type ATP synthase subunit E [Spirochaetales bacterium]|nr:V-type ATP synthase subunit E [Spirochaetales bacterium]